MKRKTLISIVLILIILLNCIMPLFVVNAAAGEEIHLNSKLYVAVKKSLSDQSISYTANDITHTLTLSPEDISRVTKLNLNEGGIYDLTGLEKFTSLLHLELSGNNLSKDSNLEALNGLPLTYLDLSTNNLEDVTAINGLIDNIISNKGTVILSGQTVTIVEEATIDIEEESNNETIVTYSLPLILERAGFLKSVWMNQYVISETGSTAYPHLEELSNPVNAANNFIKVRIMSDEGDMYKGLLKLEIYIYDDVTEAASAANLNPAATNILNGSRFYIYVVVHDSDSTAITTPDSNLYRAVKEQLTAGQTVNPNLASYPYNVNANGETIYDECTYQTGENGEYLLTIVGDSEPTYVVKGDAVYIIDYTGKMRGTYGGTVKIDGTTYSLYYYNNKIEKTTIKNVDENGTIEYKEGYKVAHNGENRNLYIRAYDEAKTFVIDNDDLYNKITNLILNNKEIRDLTGIEKFVGLDSYLNVSHNYLSDIEPIYELQINKDAKEAEIQAKFTKYLNSSQYGNLSESLTKTKSSKSAAESQIKSISEDIKLIMTKFKEAAEIKEYTEKEVEKTVTNPDTGETTTEITIEKTKNENYEKEIENKAKEIKDIINGIYGYDQVDEATGAVTHVYGKLELLEADLGKATSYSKSVYSYLSILYNIYNKDYKLATVLTPELNYQNMEEYLTYENALLGTSDSVKALYVAELTRLAGYYDQEALSNIEKELIFSTLGIYDSEEENPISKYISETVSKIAGSRIYWAERIEEIRETALYIEMINYCMINRMEEPTASAQCYVEEYLDNRIKSLEYEGIDSDFETKVYSALRGETIFSDSIYQKFVAFLDSEYVYTNTDGETEKVSTCKGEYEEFESLIAEQTFYADVSEIAAKAGVDLTNKEVAAVLALLGTDEIVKTIEIKETIDYADEYKGELNLYTELVALAGKLVANSGEVSRYITLPKLRKLDVSYNAYLEGIERIPELTGLREFYANACYITDITNVDWTSMEYLRKLGLAYNYIPNIEPLEVLTHIVEIDASHNLIEGEFKFNFTNSQKTLMNLDLSYNQIDDITSIMQWLDMWSGGNDGNYLAREDTININLQHQNLTINLEDPIWLNEYPETVNVELPKIFTQLIAIDVNRTAFGETSQNGRIESEGKYVTLNTRTVGDKKGVVTVLAMSGNNTPVETCVGEGTTATINYTVKARTVSEIKIEPSENIEMLLGEALEFKATVIGENLQYTDVTWSVEGNTSEETTISENGVLTIGINEESKEIIVRATSVQDSRVSNTVVVKLPENEEAVSNVIIDPCENIAVNIGGEKEFIATVEGPTEDKTVKWSIAGNTSEYTMISEEGKLTVGKDEKAETISVIAISNADPSKSGLVKVRIAPEDEDIPEIISVMLTPAENVQVEKGKTQRFIVTVTGTAEDKSVNWKVTGNTSESTTVLNTGLLRVGADEEAEKLIITATSNYDSSKKAQVEVKIPGNEKKEITSITVKPSENVTVRVGEEKTFEVQVEGSAEDKSVVWKLEGNSSENTKVSEEGKLSIATDETAENLTLIVTSNFDTSKFVKINVKVAKEGEEIPEITKVTVTPSENVSVKVGETKAFTVAVEGTAEDKTVSWKVEENKSDKTTISKDGALTVGSDETAGTVKVTATSNFDTSKTATVVVTVKKDDEPSNELKLGYETKEDYLIGIKTKTPIADFKKVLIGDQEYNVVIKKDGKDITEGYIETGMYVQIQDKDGNVIKDSNGDLVVFETIVKGDINGDGYANSLDSLLIKSHRAEVSILKGEAFEAADINGDGKVNATDSKLLLYHRAEVTGYDLNYKK